MIFHMIIEQCKKYGGKSTKSICNKAKSWGKYFTILFDINTNQKHRFIVDIPLLAGISTRFQNIKHVWRT